MVILTDPLGKEIRELTTSKVDIDVDSTMDFELTIPLAGYKTDIVKKGRVFVPGTEFGGVINGRKTNTAEETVIVRGRSWRGFLEKKVLKPPSGSAYKVISGELNTVIRALLSETGLTALFQGSTEDTGVTVTNYQFNRYTTLRKGLKKLLASVGYRMQLTYIQQEGGNPGYVRLEAVPAVDYSETIEVSQDSQIDFIIEEASYQVNHLICLGSGELAQRMVVDLYVQEDGTIGTTQHYFGEDEIEEIYDYSSVESAEELTKQGTEKLSELMDYVHMSMDVAKIGIDVGIGDIVGGRDYITGTTASRPVMNKIYEEEDGQTKVNYILEGETEDEDTIQ